MEISISKAIIYGNKNNVQQIIASGVNLDEIDEYGYTPLVQTAIVDDIEKAKLILKAGASVDFSDLTGRTALHWTADNNNIEFCRLLLEHKANPNSYTVAGQPVLVMPLLREQTKLKKLLYQYGGNLYFAQDFINAKLLGHRYELLGHIDIVDPKNTLIEIDFEGFFLEFTLTIISSAVKQFINHFYARHLRNYFPLIKQIIKHYEIGCELIKYQHYNLDKDQYDVRINQLLNDDFLLLPVAYSGHAISLIKYGNLLAHCDRGEYGKRVGSSVIIYRIGSQKSLNKTLIKKILYKRQERVFIERGLKRLLNLTPIIEFPMPYQITGNCSWANVEAALPVMLFLLKLSEYSKINNDSIAQARKKSIYFYHEWQAWDKRNALQNCIASFYDARQARQVTKASILAAILFQQTDYSDHDFFKNTDKILSILTLPDFNYILKTYLKIFYQNRKTKDGEKLANILEEFGVDPSEQ